MEIQANYFTIFRQPLNRQNGIKLKEIKKGKKGILETFRLGKDFQDDQVQPST